MADDRSQSAVLNEGGNYMEGFLDLIEEFAGTEFNWKVFCGVLVAVLFFVIEITCMRAYAKANGTQDKRVRKAIALGHVVTGKRVKAWEDFEPGEKHDSWYYATYEYEVGGQTYTYKYRERVRPALTMQLYYIDNPRRVFSDLKKKNVFWSMLFYLLPIAMAVAVVNLLGGI